MANPNHISKLKKGLNYWNPWRMDNSNITPDLSNHEFSKMYLSELIFDDSNISNSFFSYCDLSEASFTNCNLNGTSFIQNNMVANDMSNSNLIKAFFHGEKLMQTILYNSNLDNCDLMFCNLFEVNAEYANFNNVRIGYTNFSDVNLNNAKNLDLVIHEAPSSIGIDTIIKSRGKIPKKFLRGAGVPEEFIDYIPSLVNQPFQFYTCFISHSSKDQNFNDRLYNDLQTKGVRCWFFPEDAKWGKTVWGEIDREIKIYDKLMVVCSENSLQSEPVIREIERALQREDREHKNILFPIRIDNYVFDKWEYERKADVVNKVVGDFSEWDKDVSKYNKSLNKLIKALRAE